MSDPSGKLYSFDAAWIARRVAKMQESPAGMVAEEAALQMIAAAELRAQRLSK